MNRGWRIHQKLLLLAIGPAVVIALALGMFFVFNALSALDAELRGRGQATVRYLAPASEYGVISGNRASLQALTQAAMREPDARAVLITDAAGHILAQAGDARVLRANALQVDALLIGEDWLGFSAPILRSTLESEAVDAFDAYFDKPAVDAPAGWLVGRVYVELSTTGLQQRRADLLVKGSFILLGGSLLAAMLALRIARGVSRPVMRLAKAVRAMEEGHLDTRVSETSAGELAVLEKGFNRMAVNLQEARDTLTERIERATAQLAHQARHDPLTGLVNRREFESRVERALLSARAGTAEHAICYLDLDQFKVVNDTCGHAAGDELLRQIAALLKGRVRSRDTLARLGGDEFGVLVEGCPLADAERLAEGLRQLVEEFRFTWAERLFSVGASIGMVRVGRDAGTLVEVLGAADQACYQAKAEGRNRVVVHTPPEDQLSERRCEKNWATRLADALADRRLRLFVQSIVPLHPGRADGMRCEFLLRMLDEEGSIVPPRAFLPAAERHGLLPAIERWVVAEACAHIRSYIEATGCRRLCFAVNLSPQGVEDAEMPSWIEHCLSRNEVPPACLAIEISESTASQKLAATQVMVARLRAIGCRFGLENFGRGLASFSYLKSLAPDYVKIDAGIVREVADNRISQTLVSAVQEIATAMEIGTVAEAVDTPRSFAALRERGVTGAQGYWFGHPAEFREWLAHAVKCAPPPASTETAQILSFRPRRRTA